MGKTELGWPLPVDVAAHAHTGVWVASVLRERISEGTLTPGTKLSEVSIAGALGVSRNTLREAFTTLAGESIVQRVPNRGVLVASPGAEDIREIYRTRRIIEPGAVLWGEMTAQHTTQLQSVARTASAARDAGDIPAMAGANQSLHRTIVALTGSQNLASVMDRVLARMRLVFYGMAELPDFHTPYAGRNVELVELLLEGRRQDAAEFLRSYLESAETELLAHLDRAVGGDGKERPAQGIR